MVALIRAAMPAQTVPASWWRRLRRGAARRAARSEIVDVFTSAQLDLALGRLNVVHAALLAGRASETFLARWRILERFRADEPGDGIADDSMPTPRTKTLQNQDRND